MDNRKVAKELVRLAKILVSVKGRMFRNDAELHDAITDFKNGIENKYKSTVKIVMINWGFIHSDASGETAWFFIFEPRFSRGSKKIVLSDELRSDIDNLGQKLFGQKPKWDETMTSAEFSND